MLSSDVMKLNSNCLPLGLIFAGITVLAMPLASYSQAIPVPDDKPQNKVVATPSQQEQGEITHSPNISVSKMQGADDNQVYFACQSTAHSSEANNKIFQTVAWNPDSQTYVPLFSWKSEFLPIDQPLQLCEATLPKFQAAYDEDRLLMMIEYINGSPVVCGVKLDTDTCNGDNRLLTLAYNDQAGQDFKNHLFGNGEGIAQEMLLENSWGKVIVSIRRFLTKEPVPKKTAPKKPTITTPERPIGGGDAKK